jgi:undecaprenyl-diphosphatase
MSHHAGNHHSQSTSAAPAPLALPFAQWSASWRAVLVLIVLVTGARLVYLAWFCPYSLVEDETSYWEWSRHLDLSYYTKGPGIAWTIAATTRLLGNTMFAVRLVAVVSSAVAAFCIAGLAREATGDKRAAFWSAACFFLVPAFQFTALLSTIDGPFVACWAAAAWAGWRALGATTVPTVAPNSSGAPGSSHAMAWITLGIALGLGTLYKYTMLLAIPGLILFALLPHGQSKVEDRKPKAAIAVSILLFLLLLSPIILWNADEHWPTLGHLLGHLGLRGGDKPVTQGVGGWHYDYRWTLSFIGAQLAAGPMLLLVWIKARETWKSRGADPGAWRAAVYMLSIAAPILVFYLVVSFIATTQWNWTVTAYVSLSVLAGWAVLNFRAGNFPGRTPFVVHAWRATLIVGLVVGLGAIRLDLFAKLPVVGKYVPVWRFTGADLMARHVERWRRCRKKRATSRSSWHSTMGGRASLLSICRGTQPCTARRA